MNLWNAIYGTYRSKIALRKQVLFYNRQSCASSQEYTLRNFHNHNQTVTP
jgi:hypothetical protein